MGELIVSVHIPKTGGSTFRELLSEVAGPNLLLDYEDRPLWGNYPVRRINNIPNDQKRLVQIQGKRAESQTVVVHGHFLVSKYTSFFPRARRVVWLRDPVERIASHYYYWKRTPNLGNAVCKRLIEDRLSLVEFAREHSLRNIMSYFLDHQDIRRYDFVGITERYSDSLSLFRESFGIRLPEKDLRVYQNPDRKSRRYDLQDDERNEILSLNALDRDIYRNGLERFDELRTAMGATQ